MSGEANINRKHPRPIIAACYHLGIPLPSKARSELQPSHYVGDIFSPSNDILSEMIYRLGPDLMAGTKPSRIAGAFREFDRIFREYTALEYNKTDFAVYFTDWLLYGRSAGVSHDEYFSTECFRKELPERGDNASHTNSSTEDIDISGMETSALSRLFNTKLNRELIYDKPIEVLNQGYYHIDNFVSPRVHPEMKPRYTLEGDQWVCPSQDAIGTATLSLCGDLMCQQNMQRRDRCDDGSCNFDSHFSQVRELLRSKDLCVGELETLTDDSISYTADQYRVHGLARTNAPSIYLEALQYAGFDALVAANNHNCDCGPQGAFNTLSKLDEYGFIRTGLYADRNESRTVIINVNGIRIGLLAYTTKFNGWDFNWTRKARNTFLAKYSKLKITEHIETLRSHGVDYIIAYNHWGVEGSPEPESRQITLATEMAEAGVDYIIGSHTHCLQSYDVINCSDGRKVPVFYSLGNFVSSEIKAAYVHDLNVYVSAIVNLTLKRNPETGKVELADENYTVTRRFNEYNEAQFVIVPDTDTEYDEATSSLMNEARAYAKSIIGDKVRCSHD